MCRFTLDGYGETTDSFTGGFELARRAQGGLQNEHPVHEWSKRFDVAAAFPAADFLIRIQKNVRGYCRLETKILQRPDSQNGLCNTALHVVDAGSPDHILIMFERHFVQSTQRPDRVVMTQ